MDALLIAIAVFLLLSLVYSVIVVTGAWSARLTGTEPAAQRQAREAEQRLAEIDGIRKIAGNRRKLPG